MITVYASHGTVVPGWVIEQPERRDVAVIDAETNVEVRRVMIERMGAPRLVREGGAEFVHGDKTGRLWRRPLGTRDEPVVLVEVLNSTPEPDGSQKTYFLRVPPTMRTAREAVAWTFEMTAGGYEPTVES